MRARDAMVTDLVTVRPTDTVDVAAKMMLDHDVAYLPVVDGDMRIVGVVTEIHMVHLLLPSYFDMLEDTDYLPDDFEPFEHGLATAGDVPISEIMGQEIETADEDAPLPGLAARLVRSGVRRILVVRDGRLVGTLGRRDILSQILSH
jgi:CBS domain-containing protein